MNASLKQLETQLYELGYATHLWTQDENLPIDILLVNLESSLNLNLSWRLELYLQPLHEDAKVEKLEFVVPMIRLQNGADEAELYKRIVNLNAKIYLGCFAYNEKDRVVYFQHHILAKKGTFALEDDLLSEMLDLIVFNLNTFTGYFYNLALAEPFKEERKTNTISPFVL